MPNLAVRQISYCNACWKRTMVRTHETAYTIPVLSLHNLRSGCCNAQTTSVFALVAPEAAFDVRTYAYHEIKPPREVTEELTNLREELTHVRTKLVQRERELAVMIAKLKKPRKKVKAITKNSLGAPNGNPPSK